MRVRPRCYTGGSLKPCPFALPSTHAHSPLLRRAHRRGELRSARPGDGPVDAARRLSRVAGRGGRLRDRRGGGPCAVLRRRVQEPRPVADAPARVRQARRAPLVGRRAGLPGAGQSRHAPRCQQGDRAGDLPHPGRAQRLHRRPRGHAGRRDPRRPAADRHPAVDPTQRISRPRGHARPDAGRGERRDTALAGRHHTRAGVPARRQRPRRLRRARVRQRSRGRVRAVDDAGHGPRHPEVEPVAAAARLRRAGARTPAPDPRPQPAHRLLGEPAAGRLRRGERRQGLLRDRAGPVPTGRPPGDRLPVPQRRRQALPDRRGGRPPGRPGPDGHGRAGDPEQATSTTR